MKLPPGRGRLAKTILGERASRIRDERAREGYVSLYFHREILAESAL
jgi:hypothetical protein